MSFSIGLYRGFARRGEMTFSTLHATQAPDYVAAPPGILGGIRIVAVTASAGSLSGSRRQSFGDTGEVMPKAARTTSKADERSGRIPSQGESA
jgi:hypothetical protein